MRLEGTALIKAPRERVWAFLIDPQQVLQCAPGIESVEIVIPGAHFRATAAIGFGTVKARFTGEAEWLDLQAPERAKMKAHGAAAGGSAADVLSEMTLLETPDGHTELRWAADVSVVGQLASLAARLMTSVSQKLTGLFFDAVRQKIENLMPTAPPTATPTETPPAEAPAAEPAAPPAETTPAQA
jgi:carbon monoxide dehydrogenase subunit G